MSFVYTFQRFTFRRGTSASLATVNEVPLEAELVFEKDTGRFKIGDGVTAWNDLAYFTGGIESVVAGSHIAIDSTDPANPVISVSGVSTAGYAEGTLFPTTPALDDKFYRTDLNLLCYFDGTRWLTVQQYDMPPSASDYPAFLSGVATSGQSARWALDTTNGIYLERIVLMTYATIADASNHWTFQLSKRTAANVATNVGAAMTTNGDAINTHISHSQTVGAVIDATHLVVQMVATRTGSGTTYLLPRLIYRRIVT